MDSKKRAEKCLSGWGRTPTQMQIDHTATEFDVIRAEGENAGLEKAAVIIDEAAAHEAVAYLAERIRAAKSPVQGGESEYITPVTHSQRVPPKGN